MNVRCRVPMIVAAMLVLCLAGLVQAAESSSTVITFGEMCGGCVKRIEAKLSEFPDIADVQCDIKLKTVAVTPKPRKSLSARELWEAMESIGKTPKKLSGPEGTFTSKPD